MFDNFIKIQKYGKTLSTNRVSVSIYKKGTINVLRIHISDDLLKKIGLEKKSRVDIYQSKDNYKVFFIKKSDQSCGYVIDESGEIRCSKKEILKNISGLGKKEINFELKDGGILISIK